MERSWSTPINVSHCKEHSTHEYKTASENLLDHCHRTQTQHNFVIFILLILTAICVNFEGNISETTQFVFEAIKKRKEKKQSNHTYQFNLLLHDALYRFFVSLFLYLFFREGIPRLFINFGKNIVKSRRQNVLFLSFF